NIPFQATSSIPLENIPPAAIPTLATIKIVRRENALEPTDEFKKLTASLLTPTIKSATANIIKIVSIIKYTFYIGNWFQFFCKIPVFWLFAYLFNVTKRLIMGFRIFDF